MLKRILACAASGALALAAAAEPAYVATPLRQRVPAAPGAKPFEVLSPESTGVTVSNLYSDPRMWGDRFRELTLGAVETGIAVADFDRDGLLDIFVVSRNGPCALYRQTAPFKFVNVAAAAGVDCTQNGPGSVTSATVVDINQDGWPDLYVCRFDAPNLLFVNNGDGTFTERAHEYGLDVKDASVEATFADYDGDGYLDCFLLTNVLDFTKSPTGRRNYLFHNNGNGTFTDVAKKAGIWGTTQGHTALWFDANQDGWPDIYVANDFETPDRFYMNNGDGTFTDVVDERLPHVTYFSMGADSGDLNNDGLIDFMVTDMRDRTRAEFMRGLEEQGRGLWEMERVSELIPQYMWNATYLNTGTDRYQEIAHLIGLDATGWTWAVRMADLTNCGRQDLFFTGGMIRNFTDPDLVDKQNVAPNLNARAMVWKNSPQRREGTLAYHNLGDLKFENVSAKWGLDRVGVSFGCAIVDLAGDGDLDIVYNNYEGPPTLIRNHTCDGHRVMIKLAGRAPNLDAIGAELRIETASGVQVRQVYTERGVVASEPATVHFGLGNDTAISKLTIHWPNGQVQVLEDLPVDKLLTIRQPALAPGETAHRPPAHLNRPPDPSALFAENARARGLDFTNTYQPTDEFRRQRLLPRRQGMNGPAIAVADVNGDGLPDVFVSGTDGQPGVLFLGQPGGAFKPAPEQPWADAARDSDDVGALFFDASGKGRPDLLIVGGGVRHDQGDPALRNRLYLNDGHGHFALAPPDTLPSGGESCCVAAAADFEGTGRAGLFVGGRVVPGHWPATPRSFLYRNTGGKFVDVTDELAPGLRNIGMVTAAVWADIDGDGRPDLVLAVEWGPIVYFHNNGHGFDNWTEKAGLARRTGWWSSLAVADLAGDGRLDIIAGNVGLNTKYHASEAEPTVLFAGDLDGSGSEQLVEAQYSDGRLYPVRGRSKLSYSFPWLRRKFPTYEAYSQAAIEDIFPAEHLSKARRLEANELASGVYFQGPGGTFDFRRLPAPAQLSPINGLVVRDLDGDGILDVYCVGNNYGPEPSTGRFDGSVSILLKGDGHGGLTPVPPWRSGLVAGGDTRSAVAVSLPGQKGVPPIAVAQCNGPVLLFTPNPKPNPDSRPVAQR
ncbi:MAG: VCBS repeat-containing protein [Opitutaceae bacterium]